MGLGQRFRSLFKGADEIDLTSGSIWKPLLFLSLPIIITNLFQTAYNLADTFWLGQYSTEALAAISFAFPLVFLLISLGMGVSVAGSVLVAQYLGAGKGREAQYAASQTMIYAIIGSILLGGSAYFMVEEVLAILGASPDVLPLATRYMEVISIGMICMFGFSVFTALMRGASDTITPMLVMFGSVVLNIVIDPFLIFGWTVVENAPLIGTVAFPELGIQGAAIATVFSRGLALLIGLFLMFGGTRGIQINLRDMRPNLAFLRTVVRIGFPASIEGVGQALSMNLMLFIVAMFSEPVVAAFGIGTRIFAIIFLPAIAIARGVETMTAQNLGANNLDRAGRATGFAAKLLFAVLTGVGLLVLVFAAPIVDLFTTDPEVVDVGTEFLQYTALSFGFVGFMRAYTGSFRGAGKTVTAAGIALLNGLIRFPIALIAIVPLAEVGLWITFAISSVIGATIAYAWYRRGTWRDKDLTESDSTPDDLPIEAPLEGD